MIVLALIVYGLCLGSFVNALVWRVHAQAAESASKTPKKKYLKNLSISRGRSMCPDCHQTLAAKDLIPVFSWVSLGGKCRYCRRPISVQYPLVEIMTAGLFVTSYIYWPQPLEGLQIGQFVVWLMLLVGFMALTVYDARWMLLPTRIIYPVGALTAVLVGLRVFEGPDQLSVIFSTAAATAIGGGIFWILYRVSGGKWIGGGDIRLGWIFGALVGTPALSFMVIFIASLLGCMFALPSLFTKKLEATSKIPFGPFLVAGTFVVFLFGVKLLDWYKRTLLI